MEIDRKQLRLFFYEYNPVVPELEILQFRMFDKPVSKNQTKVGKVL